MYHRQRRWGQCDPNKCRLRQLQDF
ncbi:MAG: hypothetical protein JRJ31_22200 [Deltaproteobacteria bacterium]|nr:hypothetical protein [Deltaproteobacteria bacterium]